MIIYRIPAGCQTLNHMLCNSYCNCTEALGVGAALCD